MTTHRIFGIIALGTLLVLPGYADLLQVQGFSTGEFSDVSSGIVSDTWSYRDGGSVAFGGQAFSGDFGSPITFGTITLTSSPAESHGAAQFLATLLVTLNFNIPAGTASFADDLRIVANSNGDLLQLNFGGLPGLQTFTANGKTYTVSYDGFFDSTSKKIENLSVEDGFAEAYLRGTVRESDSALSASIAAVPEPSSIVLMLTAAGGCLVALRRKRARG